ncbi:hypothetical protein CFP56_025846, partial [Quercus suber]
MKEPNSQQTNSAILEESQVDKTEGGNVYANSVGLVDASEAGKNFEVTLDELDKKIAMFDVPPVSCGEILNPLGPLISGPSKSIPLPNSIGPLANISNLSPSHDNPVPKTSPQWAQIKRQVGISDESEALNITLVPSFESNVLLASSKILHCGEKLTVWSQSFGSIKRQLVEASKRLVLAEEAAARGASYDQVRILKLKINDLLDKESLMWIQRARSLYLQTRDSNTRYFHSRASQRYKRNQIHGLRNDQHTCGGLVTVGLLRCSRTIGCLVWARKQGLVDVIFLPFEVKIVNAIPLSLADTPDWLFWPKTSSGTYSVKSGYKLLREVDVVEAPGASDLSGNRDVWKQIWKLHVPNRIRTLLWRACCDSLPSKANQVRRKLLIDGTCPNCSLEPETITHALWSCKKLDSFAILKDATSPNTSFLELMHLAFKDPSCIETFANTMSLLWMSRNRVAFGEGGLCLEKIPDQARAL